MPKGHTPEFLRRIRNAARPDYPADRDTVYCVGCGTPLLGDPFLCPRCDAAQVMAPLSLRCACDRP